MVQEIELARCPRGRSSAWLLPTPLQTERASTLVPAGPRHPGHRLPYRRSDRAMIRVRAGISFALTEAMGDGLGADHACGSRYGACEVEARPPILCRSRRSSPRSSCRGGGATPEDDDVRKARLTGIGVKVPASRACPRGCRSAAIGSRCGSTGRRQREADWCRRAAATAGLEDAREMLFQSVDRAGGLTGRPLTRRARVVLAMIKRRAAAVGAAGRRRACHVPGDGHHGVICRTVGPSSSLSRSRACVAQDECLIDPAEIRTIAGDGVVWCPA